MSELLVDETLNIVEVVWNVGGVQWVYIVSGWDT